VIAQGLAGEARGLLEVGEGGLAEPLEDAKQVRLALAETGVAKLVHGTRVAPSVDFVKFLALFTAKMLGS